MPHENPTSANPPDAGWRASAERLAGLPAPVQRYLEHSGVLDKPWIQQVRLTQTGRFRTGAERPWMAMSAQQSYTTAPAAFTWEARFKIAGLPLLRVRDEYVSGRARMFGQLAGLIKLFDVRGEKLDQGAMMRYLSEMIWFPVAFLGDNIRWKHLDENTAQVSLHDAGKSVSGKMHFDAHGRLLNFTAMRYREVDGDFSLDPWSTPILDYGLRAGLNLPVRGQAIWNLPSGDLPYVDLEIQEIEYNSGSWPKN